MKAWITMPDGSKVDVGSNCQIGRLPGSAIHVDSVEVSRQHAFIHVQQSDVGVEFWLADLGSTNGTVRNGRRLTMPTRMQSGDVIIIGDTRMVFEQEASAGPVEDSVKSDTTQPLRATRYCWLLMVDIRNFTKMTLSMPPETLGHIVGTWLRRTRHIMESLGGVVDKFLGDAIFAYWEAGPDAGAKVAQAVAGLAGLQAEHSPDFRIVLHLGPAVFMGKAGGANNVSGPEVIYVFRIEKIGSKLRVDSVVSETAKEGLASLLFVDSIGAHKLDGFTGEHTLFKLSDIQPWNISTADAAKG